MRQCMDMENLHRRLRKIRGQVEALDRLFRIAVGDAVFHAVLDVAFEHDLTALVQRSLCSIDL